jgi:hypothetical protein
LSDAGCFLAAAIDVQLVERNCGEALADAREAAVSHDGECAGRAGGNDEVLDFAERLTALVDEHHTEHSPDRVSRASRARCAALPRNGALKRPR